MDKIVHQLGELLLTALPTFLLLIFLTYYLKYIFFEPLDKVLKQRYESTEGARKLAQESLQRVAAKAAAYDATLRAVRSEIYEAHELAYKEMQERASTPDRGSPEPCRRSRPRSQAANRGGRGSGQGFADARKPGPSQPDRGIVFLGGRAA